MAKLNAWITAALGLAAALSWFLFSVAPSFGGGMPILNSYAAVQMPMAVTLTAAACFGWLLVARSERRGDDETRCRKCRHILRGLSEPRCPECGERI